MLDLLRGRLLSCLVLAPLANKWRTLGSSSRESESEALKNIARAAFRFQQ
jgi:hypothetical protein